MVCEETEIRDRIQNVHCESCNDLLEYLRPSHDRWLNHKWQVEWIFRGHQREDWKLEPSVLRNNAAYFDAVKSHYESEAAITHVMSAYVQFPPPKNTRLYHLLIQTLCEKTEIHNFIQAADEVGLLIPDDNISRDFQLNYEDFLHKLMSWQSHDRRGGIIPIPIAYKVFNLLPWYLQSDIVALAQHHSVPTRLLDWTENPLIAAYFAASGERDKRTENIVVWAMNRVSMALTSLRIIKPRRSRIGFLHAQDGLFVYDTSINTHYIEHENWRTFETTMPDLDGLTPGYWLRKITLPSKHAEELLNRLKPHKIEQRFLMPTYDNVGKSFRFR